MRLGVVGMLPPDFRAIRKEHLQAVQALDLSTACFHIGPDILFKVQPAECHTIKQLYAEQGMPLVQMGIGYGECLFDPAAEVRDRVVRSISRGIELARALDVQVALIRPGSLTRLALMHLQPKIIRRNVWNAWWKPCAVWRIRPRPRVKPLSLKPTTPRS